VNSSADVAIQRDRRRVPPMFEGFVAPALQNTSASAFGAYIT